MKSNNLTELNLLNNLLENILITNITLGTPKQIIPLQIKLRRYPLSITCYEKNINNCNNNNSSSYYSLIEEEQYNNEDFTFGIESLETFIINNEKIEKIKFFIATKMINNISGILGLNIFGGSKYTEGSNLIIQLKKRNIINSYEFFIDYINENDGNLIIGDYPHNYYNNTKYKSENFKIIKPYFKETNKIYPKIPKDLIQQNFDLLLNNVIYGNNNIEELIIGKLSIESGLIRSTTFFGKKIKEIFFDKYLKNGMCEINYIKTKYAQFISFVCNEKVDIKKFENIKFKLDDMITEFILTYEDLFYKFNKKYFFLIYYKDDYGDFWELGKPFMKKYMFFFNQDKKIIGYYIYNSNNFYLLPWFLIFFFFFIIIFMGIIISKLIIHKKKFKAKELEENLFYL